MGRLVKDGNKVYEIDEECMRQKERGQADRAKNRSFFKEKEEAAKEKRKPLCRKCARKIER